MEEEWRSKIDEAFVNDIPLWQLLRDTYIQGKVDARQESMEEWNAEDDRSALEHEYLRGKRDLVEEAKEDYQLANIDGMLVRVIKMSTLEKLTESEEYYD